MRIEGYYWCKFQGQWDSIDGLCALKDEDFDEIDERRIVREPTIKQAFDAGTNYATYNGRPGYPDAPNFEQWKQQWTNK